MQNSDLDEQTGGIPYHTPATNLLGQPPKQGGLARGVIVTGGAAHEVVLVKIEGDEVLVSGATFYGWVDRRAFIEEAE